MQSVYKLPIAMAILDQVERKTLTLDQKVSLSAGDMAPSRHAQPDPRQPSARRDRPQRARADPRGDRRERRHARRTCCSASPAAAARSPPTCAASACATWQWSRPSATWRATRWRIQELRDAARGGGRPEGCPADAASLPRAGPSCSGTWPTRRRVRFGSRDCSRPVRRSHTRPALTAPAMARPRHQRHRDRHSARWPSPCNRGIRERLHRGPRATRSSHRENRQGGLGPLDGRQVSRELEPIARARDDNLRSGARFSRRRLSHNSRTSGPSRPTA